MKNMRKTLEDFLEKTTPEQLRMELTKGNRPFFQTLEDASHVKEQPIPSSVPAHVSFFKGIFVKKEAFNLAFSVHLPVRECVAANEPLALAA
jgi:hypothetical protein